MEMAKTKIFSIYNNKGGVGKTTTTKYYAKYLAKRGKSVLLIDMDPQGNLTSQFKFKNKNENISSTITDLLLYTKSSKNCIQHTEDENIDIITSSLSLLKVNNQILLEASIKNPIKRLVNQLKRIDKQYDYILIDCPPTMDILVANALCASHEIIIPIKSDNYSLDGINLLLENIEEVKLEYNKELKINSIFINEADNTNLCKELYDELQKLKFFNPNTIGRFSIIKNDTFHKRIKEKELENHKIMKQYEELFTSFEFEVM